MELNDLIKEWRFRQCLDPLHSDTVIERRDDIQIEEYMKRIIDKWYIDLIDRRDPSLTPPDDITQSINLINFNPACPWRGATFSLPDNFSNMHSITSPQWDNPALLTTPDTPLAAMQAQPRLAGSRWQPVAVLFQNYVHIYAGSDPIPARFTAFTYTPGIYNLTPKALSTIPTSF